MRKTFIHWTVAATFSVLAILSLIAVPAFPTTKTLVDTDSTQTLTNKTLTAPTITSPTITGNVAGGASYADIYLSGTITGTGASLTNIDLTGNTGPLRALGDTVYGAVSGAITKLAGNTTTTKKFLSQTGTGTVSAAPSWDVPAPRSYLAGLTLSTAGSSATMSIAAGQATDSTNVASMVLSSSIGKTTSAWAVGNGNGGLDTGSIANSTWYYFFLIMRSDTGVVDVLFSTSSSSPTMPANYDYKRYIGAGFTDVAAQWRRFFQSGDEFLWETPFLDINAANGGTSAVSRTLTVPRKTGVWAIINVKYVASSNPAIVYLSSPDSSDMAASQTAAPLGGIEVDTGFSHAAVGWQRIRINSLGQIRSRESASGASNVLRIATLGWVDRRGRDD